MSKNKGKKQKQQPKVVRQVEPVPPPRKRPVPTPPEVDGDPCLVFGLQLADNGGKWAWSKMTAAELKLVTDKCKEWERTPANQLFTGSGHKPILFENLCAEAQRRLRDIELEEYDGQWWELRLTGQRRIWGVRQRHVFYVVWWDPGHTACPAPKKYT
jgi:hypothetical protein